MMSENSSPSHSTDTSLSLSAGLLPEQNAVNEQKTSEQQSSISEHISSVNSLENDRSLVEIEISNIPDVNTLIHDDENEEELISASPPLSPPHSLSLPPSNRSNSAGKNAKSVLEEILHNEQFKSEERSDRRDSTDDATDLDIFDGVQLDDDSINDYVRQLHAQRHDDAAAVAAAHARTLDDACDAKDSIIRALSEPASATLSADATTTTTTTCTEYRQLQAECASRCVSYEGAVAHRDALIARMQDALVAAQRQAEEARAEVVERARDVQCAQAELAEAVAHMRRCHCTTNPPANVIAVDNGDLEDVFAELGERFGVEHGEFLDSARVKITDHFTAKLASKDSLYQQDVAKLQEKHVQEMEDTRKFYEKKCADIISDELVSQASRRLPDDDIPSDDDDDLADLYPDYGRRSPLMTEEKCDWTPEAVAAFKHRVDAASRVLNKYDMEHLGEEALTALKATLARFRFITVDAHEVEALHQREIDDLHEQLRLLQQEKVQRDAETQANTGEHEIDGIVKGYQTRLHEQVELAKVDIMLALEDNISRLAQSDCDDDQWPKEFVEIRHKLSARYLDEIEELKRTHDAEVQRLKQEVGKARNAALARLAAQRSTSTSHDHGDDDVDEDAVVAKERHTTHTLRNLLIDCYQYFAQCEAELNTTLFDELARHAALDSDSETNANETSTSSSSQADATLGAHRVHLAPNIQEFIEKIDRFGSGGGDVALEFKRELSVCLERLRVDANAILALTCRTSEPGTVNDDRRGSISAEKRLSLNGKSVTETQVHLNRDDKSGDQIDEQHVKEELVEAKKLLQTMEIERGHLDAQMEAVITRNRITEGELAKAREKIAELIEYSRKEIVSEGYGENVLHGAGTRTPLAELIDRARQLLAENKSEPKTLQIIEELTRECDQLVEDGKRERQDFMLQIESADKKLKSTQRFLEEQAVEREQERDEAHRTISVLRDQLKEMQKDRAGYERVHEVTTPEGSCTGAHHAWAPSYYEAITKTVEGFEQQMCDMSQQIADGERRFQEVNGERAEAIEKIGLLRDIIKDLEKQIRVKETLESELKSLLERQREANDDLVQQLEAATNTTDFQKHIIQLEEEVSKLRRASDIVGNEGLIKQIQLQLHDLELSVDKNIREIESLYATRSSTTCSTPSEEMSVQDQIRPKTPNSTADDCEVPLQQLARLKEKLVKHSRAEHSAIKRIQDMELQLLQAKQEHDELLNEKEVLQDQASEQLVLISSLQMRLDDQRIRAEHVQKQANASLEMRIYDLENDLQSVRDKLQSRESTIKQLNKVIEETKQRLQDREDELSATLEESEICELKTHIERLKTENEMMRLKIESDAQNAQILPSLVDNIIADKNKDIESLRGKLEETERQFELYRSMTTIDKSEEMARGLSYFNVSSPERLRNASSVSSLNATKFVPEISSIEKVGPPNVNYTTDASLMKPNSTEINHKTTVTERHVHFEDDSLVPQPTTSAEYVLLQAELDKVRAKLKEAEGTISELRVDLAEVNMHITDRENDIRLLRDDIKRKDDMYMKLAKEKREVVRQFDTLDAIRQSIEDLQNNEERLKIVVRETEERYVAKEASLQNLQREFATYQLAKEEEIVDITREGKTRYEQILIDYENLSVEMESARLKLEEVDELKKQVIDRDNELKSFHADVSRYQREIRTFEERLKQFPNDQLQLVLQKKELAEKELEIVKLKATIDGLKRETGNILDHLIVKEEIIDTMKVDSEALRINLETIKAKMSESGNVYDLRQKLRERELTAQLHTENEASIEDVASQVRKQLNDSAQLDDKLLNALGSGDFNLGRDDNEVVMLESKLTKERSAKELLEDKVRTLESTVGELQETVRQLQDALTEQKKLFDHVQVEDTNLMTQLRGKLEEAMETELEYEAQVSKEKALRVQLENELTILRRSSNSISTNSTTEYVSLGNLQEQRLQRQVKQLQDELGNIKRELKNQKKVRNTAECELKYSKEMLALKTTEVAKLEKRILDLESEVRKAQDDLRQRKNELDMKTWEVESGKSAVASLEQEKLQLNVQVSLLKAKQSTAASPTAVPAFLQKMKDLGELVTDHISENRLMTDTVAKLTTERNVLEERIRELEARDQRHVPFDDPVARANHLFGKYLRADSYRHALSYQKKYLIGLLATYQSTVALPLSKFEPKNAATKRRGTHRFRAAVVVCIAVFRMRYMVQRWHSGSRNGAYMSASRKTRAEPVAAGATHFHVGKPVSGEHFRTVGATAHAHTTHRQVVHARANHVGATATGTATAGIPWSGMSPPSKDAAQETTHRHEHFEQLRAPTVDLDSYFERFNLIQQRLGTTLNSFNS